MNQLNLPSCGGHLGIVSTFQAISSFLRCQLLDLARRPQSVRVDLDARRLLQPQACVFSSEGLLSPSAASPLETAALLIFWSDQLQTTHSRKGPRMILPRLSASQVVVATILYYSHSS